MTTESIFPSAYSENDKQQMTRAMGLSLGIGFLMLFIKMYAYFITGSAAILSDAAESVVHILAVSFAAYSLRLSLKPADDKHMYGHDRISFFSAGFEGAMIILAAFYIIYESINKWIHGLSIDNLDTGTLFIVAATAINGALGLFLLRKGKKYGSIVLEANGKHVLTDSWTSLGVIIGLVLVLITGWLPFDPILAIIVAMNILWTGFDLMRRSIGGLMDESDPASDAVIRSVLERETAKYGITYHDMRHRNAGNKLLVEFHLQFPENISLAAAHEQATHIELELHHAIPHQAEILSHLEPLEGHDEIHESILKGKPIPPPIHLH